MRAFDCPCGEHLEAQNDEKLTEEARSHSAEEHPDQYEDWELRQLVTTGAYDAAA